MKRGVTILNWQRKCILTTLLVLSSLFLVFSTITYASERDFKDSLKITTQRISYLLLSTLIGDNLSALI